MDVGLASVALALGATLVMFSYFAYREWKDR